MDHHQRDRPLAEVLVGDAGTVDRLRPSGLGHHAAMVTLFDWVMQPQKVQACHVGGGARTGLDQCSSKGWGRHRSTG